MIAEHLTPNSLSLPFTSALRKQNKGVNSSYALSVYLLRLNVLSLF